MRTEKFSKKDGFSVTFPALLFCATLVSGFLLVRFLEGIGTEHLTTQGQNALTAMVKGVENEFHSSSAAVTAMSGSPWILPALSSPDPENFDKAYSVLARYNDSIGFSVCYLLDSKGAVIVSSNRNMPDSFVGKNYSFRPYFQEAISGKPAVYLATGITSLERGFYAAHPVRDSEGYIRGVVAIKTNVDAMKQILKAYPTSFFVNPDGVIFMSGSPEMVFQSLWPVPPDRGRELKDSKQFGRDSFQPVFGRPLRQGDRVRFRGEKHFCLRTSLGLPGWSLVLLVPMKEVTYFGFLGWVVTGFAAGMIIVL
ncbi:MAG TPA: cache domain-containing protein, partial [Candidatus Omnitrophota bacterium]|nr:cache domain-containing protein [Candidatus Omnitrophota bacterium]